MINTIPEILEINDLRRQRLIGDSDQLTGHGMPGNRRKILIPDYHIPQMWLNDETIKSDIYQKVIDAGTIKNYAAKDPQHKTAQQIDNLLTIERCKHDPAFAFIKAFYIKDKQSGKIMPFKLNYAQRVLLEEFELLREKKMPIRVILLKARQWGGSTLTQLYMAWIQLFVKEGWNSLIVAQTKDTARRIKAMYSKVLDNFPLFILNRGKLKFAPHEGSNADSVIKDKHGKLVRTNVTTVSSFENYESTRGSDVAMAHFSEVAYWKTTPQKSAAGLIRAVTSGMAEGVELIVEVMESTANGKSGYFYDEYQEAKVGNSARKAVFIPFFYIENDMLEFKDEKERQLFAQQLIDNASSDVVACKTAEPGSYLYSLWEKGATLEHIKWYVERRKLFHSHAQMASEAPSDDIECFTFSGKLVISPELIAKTEMEQVKMPIWQGEIEFVDERQRRTDMENGPMKIWENPDNTYNNIYDRYMVVVDVGGRNENADYSVITVFDRLYTIDREKPLLNQRIPQVKNRKPGLYVVARWRGHLRYDIMAMKAVEIARMYNDALLVFESNTFDYKRAQATEFVENGDHFIGILNTIADKYNNLYVRPSTTEEDLHNGAPRKYGFQTNRATKQAMVDKFTVEFEDGLFFDPDQNFYKELAIYEQRPDGSYGNIPGANNHDDIVMTNMIGCLVNISLGSPLIYTLNNNPTPHPNYKPPVNESTI